MLVLHRIYSGMIKCAFLFSLYTENGFNSWAYPSIFLVFEIWQLCFLLTLDFFLLFLNFSFYVMP